jgi:hypothetical protein
MRAAHESPGFTTAHCVTSERKNVGLDVRLADRVDGALCGPRLCAHQLRGGCHHND